MGNVTDLRDFEGLYKDHFHFLSAISFHIVRDADASKDIVQDFFVYYWERQNSINLNYSFRSYATKAVKNLSFQFVKKEMKKNSKEADIPFVKFPEAVSTEENILGKTEALSALIALLPEARRKIFYSYVVNNYSYAEIAENYDISINTVKTQMKRAYAFLRKNAKREILFLVLSFILP